MELSGAQVRDHVGGDFELLGIAWRERGRDLRLALLLPGGKHGILDCPWAAGLDVNLSMKDDEASSPLSWEASFERTEKGRWMVHLDFARQGEIRFECNDLVLTLSGDA